MIYKIPNEILDLLMPISRDTETSPFLLIEKAILQQYKNKESMSDKNNPTTN